MAFSTPSLDIKIILKMRKYLPLTMIILLIFIIAGNASAQNRIIKDKDVYKFDKANKNE